MDGKNGWMVCMVRRRNKKESDAEGGSDGRGFEKDVEIPEMSSEHSNAKLLYQRNLLLVLLCMSTIRRSS